MSTTRDTLFWNRNALKYAARPVADPAGYARTLEHTRSFLARDRYVLELGCGTGSTALELAPAVWRYVATDASTRMIEIAEEKQAAVSVPGLSFRAGTVDVFSAESVRFDAVLAFNYLHLVRDLPDTLCRIRSLLKPEGVFISKTPCIGDMSPFIGFALIPVMRALGKAPFVNILRAANLARYLDDAGFTVVVREEHAADGSASRPFIVARRR